MITISVLSATMKGHSTYNKSLRSDSAAFRILLKSADLWLNSEKNNMRTWQYAFAIMNDINLSSLVRRCVTVFLHSCWIYFFSGGASSPFALRGKQSNQHMYWVNFKKKLFTQVFNHHRSTNLELQQLHIMMFTNLFTIIYRAKIIKYLKQAWLLPFILILLFLSTWTH